MSFALGQLDNQMCAFREQEDNQAMRPSSNDRNHQSSVPARLYHYQAALHPDLLSRRVA